MLSRKKCWTNSFPASSVPRFRVVIEFKNVAIFDFFIIRHFQLLLGHFVCEVVRSMMAMAVSRLAASSGRCLSHSFTNIVALQYLPATSRLRSSVPHSSPGAQFRFFSSETAVISNPISYKELKAVLSQPTTELVLIDVREPEEFAEGNVPTSKNVPCEYLSFGCMYMRLSRSLWLSFYLLYLHVCTPLKFLIFFSVEEFINTVASNKAPFLPANKLSKNIVLYCFSGVRSQKACNAAIAAGYKNVRNFRGSWKEWAAQEGIPILP